MAKYAKIDPQNPDTHQVLGWYDTEFAAYREDFSSDEFVPISDSDWENRFQSNFYNPNTSEFCQEDTSKALENLRKLKKNEIQAAYVDELRKAHFKLSLGWEIDCRKSPVHDDFEIMHRLFRMAQKAKKKVGDPVCDKGIKGYDDKFHQVTVKQMRDVILPEMDAFLLGLQEKKLNLYEKIAESSSEELSNLSWD